MEIKAVWIRNGDLLIADQSWQRLSKAKLNDKARFWVAKHTRDWRQAIEDYNVARDAIVEQVGNGKPIAPNTKQMNEFIRRNNSLLEIEIEIELPYFTLKEAPDELTAEDLANLWFMFDLDDIPDDKEGGTE